MPETHPSYPPEFRRQMVELVRSGRIPGELAKEFEPSDQTIRNWVAQANLNEGLRQDGLKSAEREELQRLRRENKQLRQEREILAKAAAWFARTERSVQEFFMRLASFISSAVGGILVLCSISGVAAQSGAGEPPRSGWYVGGGIGSNWASDLDQEGWNRDPLCYPTDLCFDAAPVPEISGYRWRYDIDAGAGAVFEVSAGLIFDRARMELSIAQRKNGLDQMFRSITDYDGTSMVQERRGGSVVSNAQASIDHLTVRTLSLNAYYAFPGAYRGISPYLGGGLGPAFVEVSGVRYSNDYEDTSGNAQAYDPPLSFYNSRQDAGLSDTVLAGHLHVGADYSLNDKVSLELKLTCSMMGDIEDSSGYSLHPLHERDPDFPNHNTFIGSRYWTLTFTAKRLFGN